MVGQVHVQAPVRVLDAGGWTDTWFAQGGTVCNLAVEDGIEVVATLGRGDSGLADGTVELDLPFYGDRYSFSLDDALPGLHPLLEAAVRRWAPARGPLSVEVNSSVPPGSGLGTSASVVVGLIVALKALRDEVLDRAAVARAAHEIEAVDLGLESGVQDQVAAAYGGATLIEVAEYPDVEVQPLDLTRDTWEALTRRMLTVFLGSSRHSTDVHQAVIAHLSTNEVGAALFPPLRSAAHQAAAALTNGNIEEYGVAMIANTEGQAALHPALVDSTAQEVIEVARQHGAVGWKVNGAGGTVTVITPDDPTAVRGALGSLDGLTVLPLRPAKNGVRIVRDG